MNLRLPKALIPALLAFFFPKSKDDKIKAVLKNPGRILLIRQSMRLGNTILMNSAISGLKEAFPKAEIDVMFPSAFAPLMKMNKSIGSIIPVLKKEYIYKPWQFVGLIQKLRRRKYDLVIDCSDNYSPSSTSAIYTLFCGAEVTAGWARSGQCLFDIEIATYRDIEHATKMYLRLLSGIFQRPIEGSPFFDIPGRQMTEERPVIGINCGGRNNKRWDLGNFIELARRLAKDGNRIELIMGPDEMRLRQNADLDIPQGCTFLPPLSIKDLADLISKQDLFISSDTGPMHLAWSLNVPVVAIFLCSSIDKYRPLSDSSIAIDGKDGITVDEVYEKAISILNYRKAMA